MKNNHWVVCNELYHQSVSNQQKKIIDDSLMVDIDSLYCYCIELSSALHSHCVPLGFHLT